MYVYEISDELCEQSGMTATGPNSIVFYKRLTRAVQACYRQGLFDAQQYYLDLPVQAAQPGQPGPLVILPREVLAPITININRNPSFSRTRLYEFSLSGPGNQIGGFSNWDWAENLFSALLAFLPSIGSKLTVVNNAADQNLTISFFGLDVNNNEISDTITLNNTGAPQTTSNVYAVVRRVNKSITQFPVTVTQSDGTQVANYYGNETNPRYRVIKLARKATSIHMLFKATPLDLQTLNDYIPLDSHEAVLSAFKMINLMLDSQAAPAAEVTATKQLMVAALQEEQQSRQAAAELAAANQQQPALNLNINNRDSLIAADVIDDVFDIFGPVGLQKALDRLTDACVLADQKSQSWKLSEGYADINVGKGGIVTFPREIFMPIKIRSGRGPMMMRNRWFEFHLNGWNNDCFNDEGFFNVGLGHSHSFWDDRSKSVTVNDPDIPFKVVALNDLGDDDGANVTVYGYDQDGKWVRTPNEDLESDDKFVDGYVFQANFANTLPDPLSPTFSRITRITRDQTDGYQQLLAYTTDGNQEPILIGYYYPDETEPNYSRIKLPRTHHNTSPTMGNSDPDNDGDTDSGGRGRWIRIRYKKRALKVTQLTDNLNVSSRLAIIEFLMAIKTKKDDPQKAEIYEATGTRYLQEKEATDNPSEQMSIELEENWQSSTMGQF